MNIKLGWSGDIHGTWTKMAVEVEEIDLIQHLADAGVLEPERMRISSSDKFKLMYAIAEIFVSTHKMMKFPEYFATAEEKQKLQALVKTRNDLTQTLVERPPF